MFLTKSLVELESSIVEDNIVIENYDILKYYLITRLDIDEKLSIFNNECTIKKKEIKQILSEECISNQRVIAAIVMFNKFYKYDSDIHKSVDSIYNLIVSDLSQQYKYFYVNNEVLLKNCIGELMKLDSEKEEIKNNNKLILSKLRNEIYECGFIPAILNNTYNYIKLSISTYKNTCGKRYNAYISNEMKELKDNLEYLMTDVFIEELKKQNIFDNTTQYITKTIDEINVEIIGNKK